MCVVKIVHAFSYAVLDVCVLVLILRVHYFRFVAVHLIGWMHRTLHCCSGRLPQNCRDPSGLGRKYRRQMEGMQLHSILVVSIAMYSNTLNIDGTMCM